MHHRFKRRNRVSKIVLAIVNQPDVEPDSRNLRRQMFSLAQHLQRLRPLLAAHVDHTQIRVRARHLRIDRKHASKRMFGFVQVSALQRRLTPLKKLLRIDVLRWQAQSLVSASEPAAFHCAPAACAEASHRNISKNRMVTLDTAFTLCCSVRQQQHEFKPR